MNHNQRHVEFGITNLSGVSFMKNFENVAILGAGVIGASWTALVLASGRNVTVFDQNRDAESSVRGYIDNSLPILRSFGLAKGQLGQLHFSDSAASAVSGADFVQENVPEILDIKHALFAEIESHITPRAVVASSASGLTLSQMQQGWKDPKRFVLGPPFNPPHLIPLVEVMGNDRTSADVVEEAENFYQAIGKITIRVNSEVPGHVANRLQAAVWREAIHLVYSGVASVGDVDKAMWAGPGLRWAAMGPTMLFHLGAGAGGLAEFCNRYTKSFNTWWDDLGVLHLDKIISEQLVKGVEEEAGGQSHGQLTSQRDSMIAAIQLAAAQFRKN